MTKKNLIKTQKRVRENGEVFTPPDFAKIILAKWVKSVIVLKVKI